MKAKTMVRYFVEEYDGEGPTGRAWDVEAPDATEAAMRAMDQKLQSVKKDGGQLKAKVSRLDRSSTPEFVDLYQPPHAANDG
jgi:hypothetical protein